MAVNFERSQIRQVVIDYWLNCPPRGEQYSRCSVNKTALCQLALGTKRGA